MGIGLKKTENQTEELTGIIRELHNELYPHKGERVRISLDTSLERDLGIDSLGRMELLLRIEKGFNVRLSGQVIASAESPRDLLRAISSAAPAGQTSFSGELRHIQKGGAEDSPAEANTLTEVLDWHLASHKERNHIYLIDEIGGEEKISYGDLFCGASAVADGLAESDLQPGQTVAIMLPSGKEYFYSFLGVLFAGGIPVPLYPPARLSQIEEHMRRHTAILNNALSSILITTTEAKPVARLLKSRVISLRRVLTVNDLLEKRGEYRRPTLRGEDTALLQYTSGTTGNPKGVVLTHANLLANIRAMGENVKATSGDVFVSWLPLYHDMGLIGAWLGSLYYGMPLALMSPLSFLARPESWLRAIHRYGGTISGGPNFGYELCIGKIDDSQLEGLDLSSWRMAFNGAEAVSPETLSRFIKRFGANGFKAEAFAPVYGLAESSVGLAFPPLGRGPIIDRVQREPFMRDRRAIPADEGDPNTLHFVASGRPLVGHEIRIVDSSEREVGEREEGQLQFRGPSATSGYFRNSRESRRLFHGEWLDSGDMAYIAGGDVYLTGRKKDIIIRAGRNIYPDELEEAVGNVPGIRKGCVAAFGSMDSRSGTERLIIIAETRETNREELDRLHAEINALTVDLLGIPPEEIVIVPPQTILKTSSGKIRRAASRELYEGGRMNGRKHPVPLQFVRLMISGLPPQIRRIRRNLEEYLYASYAWTLFSTLAVITWTMVAVMPNVTWRRKFIARMARLAVSLSGSSLAVHGRKNLKPEEPFIIVANHSSYVDGIILTAVLPAYFGYVAKRDFKINFIPGLFLRRIEAHFVDRFGVERGLEDAKMLSLTMREGKSLVFFPEGTFERMPGLLPFHMGAFVSAAETGIPVLPVTIRGSRSMLRAWSWFPRRSAISVYIGNPIKPEGPGWAAAVRLRDAARADILRHCGEPDLAL